MSKTLALRIEGDQLVFADFSGRANVEIIAVYQSGSVFVVDFDDEVATLLGKLPFSPSELKLKMYCFENYVSIVQRNGLYGVVLDVANPNFLKIISRVDYHSDICIYPIAFCGKGSQTLLIHGTEWNRLDITCLETDELLTARLVDDETDTNYFDYFHSSLLISPDSQSFTSNGWYWGPRDEVTIYDIETFLTKFELEHIEANFDDRGGYNWDRPLCWINETTIGIGHNKGEEIEDAEKFSSEILFFDIKTAQIVQRINFDGFSVASSGEATGSLFFDDRKELFVGLNRTSGLLVTDVNGVEVYRNERFSTYQFSERHKVLFQADYGKQQFTIDSFCV